MDAIARTDRFLDALATREPVDVADPDDEVLAALLEEWRDDLRWPPASALVSEEEAAAALQSGLAARRHSRRALAMVGSVAAAVLALGGFGAMVGGAHPGDALYGVHTMLFGESPSVHDDQVELSAKTELAKVQQMIAQGQWDQAQDKLAAVSNTVQTVNDTNRKQGLIDQVNQLNAKVATRDPNATLAPTSPPPNSVSSSASASASAGPPPSESESSSTTTQPSSPTAATTSSASTDASTTATASSPAATSPTSTPTTSPAATSPSQAPSASQAPQTAIGTSTASSAPAQPPSQVVGVTPTTTAAPSASTSMTNSQPIPAGG